MTELENSKRKSSVKNLSLKFGSVEIKLHDKNFKMFYLVSFYCYITPYIDTFMFEFETVIVLV